MVVVSITWMRVTLVSLDRLKILGSTTNVCSRSVTDARIRLLTQVVNTGLSCNNAYIVVLCVLEM